MTQTPEQERAYWDAHTQRSEQFGGDWDDDACLREVGRGIGAAFPPNASQRPAKARVLELGCGTGRLLVPLARKFPGIYWFGVDSSSAMLQDYPVLNNLGYTTGDGRTLRNPALTGPWDAAYSVLLFQHLPPDATYGYLNELHRVLRPGGRLVFQFVHADTDGSHPGYVEAAPFNWWWNAGYLAKRVQDRGFTVEHWDVGRVFPNWAWVTAVKQ